MHPLPPGHSLGRAGVTGYQQGGGMSPALRVVVYPPDNRGGRRVRCDGEILGRALGPADLLEFLRRASLDPDVVRLDDPLLVEWRAAWAAVWSPTPANSERSSAGRHPARVAARTASGQTTGEPV